MTATLARRWWAPAEPGIGPDLFDLSLLEPGDEPDKDLGQQLLALHRVGAAACEAVATQPLADEVTLRGVLAAAREMVAPPAIEAISKAVDGPYGALLLRDVLDDAEQAAISLYRTCITKQMAPSMAAHRVGLVYGVPLRELGRYSMVATDPKVTKQVVEELADKTLLGFVGKMVAEEAPQGAKQLVSKAPVREREATQTRLLQALFDQADTETATTPDDPATPYHDARNRGRFAVEGTTVGPEKVGATSLKRPSLKRTSLKRTSLARPTSGTDAEVSGVSATGVKRSRVRGSGVRRSAMTPSALRVQQLLPELEVPVTALVSDGGDLDYLSHKPDRNAGEYEALWNQVSYVFPVDIWHERKAGMAVARDDDGNESLMFRGRALEGGGGFESHPEDGHDVGEHAHARETLAEVMRAREDHRNQPPAIVTRIENAAEILHDRRSLEAEKDDFLVELENQLGRRLNRATEKGFIIAAADHDDPETLVLVWQPPTPGRQPLDRPVKTIVEVYVDEEATRGINDGSRVGTDLTLDPNLPLQVLGGHLLWRDDPRGGYFIRQYDAIEAEDSTLSALAAEKAKRAKRRFGKRLVVSKAVSEKDATRLAQLQGLFDRADQAERDWHGKDPGERNEQTGEFQRVTSLKRTSLKRSSLQRARLQHGGHAQLQSSGVHGSSVKTSGVAVSGVARSGLKKTELKQIALAAAKGSDEQTVYLDESFDYQVLDMQQVGFLLDDSGLRYLEEAYERTFKPGFGSTAMIADKWKITSSSDARQLLLAEADHRFTSQPLPTHGGLWKPTGIAARFDSDKDLPGIALDIEDYLQKNPQAQMIRSVITETDSGWQVRVMVNAQDLGHGHMVRFDEPARGPIRLRPEEPRRLTNAKGIEHWLMLRFHGTRQLGGGGSTDYMPVPTVVTWAVEQDDDEP